MREAKVRLYRFDELLDSVKETVMAKFYEEEDYFFLSEDLSEWLYSDPYNIFSGGADLIYSLRYCQGDGLRIHGNIDLNRALILLFPDMKKKKREKYVGNIAVWTDSNNRYCYASKGDIRIDGGRDLTDKEHDYFFNHVVPFIQEHYMELCKSLERKGYEILEYRMTHNEFSDMSDNNEWEYLITGELWIRSHLEMED